MRRTAGASYTSDLWSAAYIIMGGCSEDFFDYFRAWFLFLGKEPYEEAIRNPESILSYLAGMEEEDVPEFEEFLSCACMAFEEKTGLDQEQYLNLYERLSGDDSVQPEMELTGRKTTKKVCAGNFRCCGRFMEKILWVENGG